MKKCFTILNTKNEKQKKIIDINIAVFSDIIKPIP